NASHAGHRMDQRRRPKFRRRKPLPPSPEAPSEGAGPRVPAYGKGRRPAPAGARGLPKPTHWGDVAEWYDGLVGEHGDEYQQKVVLPGVLRLLSVGAGDRVLDVACGQGVLSRLLHARGVSVTGVDAAEKLIELARQRCDPSIRFIVADARNLVSLPTISEAHFTAAACVLAIQNIDPIAPVFEGVARALQPGGRFVLAMMHPAFRAPKSAHWGWDEKARVQYRRIDRYLTPRREPIITHPGKDP